MEEIKVFWHKSPDTDSICSAIIFADYLNKKWINAIAYKLWELNNETKYLLELLNIEIPKTINSLPIWSKVALVDHNEKAQSINNFDELEIEYIIDHHKVMISSSYPINIRMEKLTSTASILYKMYKEGWVEISEHIAKLIIWAILSDSLFFKSTTTTPYDKKICENLKWVAKINNLESYAYAMFDAKSDLWDIEIEDLIKYDYKEFEINWIKFWSWAIETTNPWYALWRKEEILEWLKKIKIKDSLNFIILSIVDIINEKNTTIVLNWKDSEIMEKIFGLKVQNNLIDLKNRLSRKKQILPLISEYFEKNNFFN